MTDITRLCLECEKPIPAGRLKAQPSATLCVPCKEEEERRGTTCTRAPIAYTERSGRLSTKAKDESIHDDDKEALRLAKLEKSKQPKELAEQKAKRKIEKEAKHKATLLSGGNKRLLIEIDAKQMAESVISLDSIEGDNKLAGLRQVRTKQALAQAYDVWHASEGPARDYRLGELMSLVRTFAYLKTYHLEYDFRNFGSADTADDFAQNIAVKVLKNLKGIQGKPFTGNGYNFYSWVHTIAYNYAADAFKKLKKEQETKFGLEVSRKDGEGMMDNPDLYDENGNPGSYFPSHSCSDIDAYLVLPAGVEGVDLVIVRLMAMGYTYAEIGALDGWSEAMVQKRMSRLTAKLADRKNKGKQASSGHLILVSREKSVGGMLLPISKRRAKVVASLTDEGAAA